MKRLRKLFAAGLMTVVTGFACVGGAIANFTKAFFSSGSVNAGVGENIGNSSGDAVKRGKVVTVSNFPSTENLERGQKINLPYLASGDVNFSATTGDELYAEITNPYGVKLTKYNESLSTQGD